MRRLTLTFGLVAMAAVLAACSGASAAPATEPPAPSSPTSGDVVAIAAKDMVFSPTEVVVPAGQAFELAFDNQDSMPHNVAISDGSGASVYKGEIVSATVVRDTVPALAPGTYTFICEVHPDMKGTIVAK